VSEIARARELPPAQLALAWHLHKPGVTAPIVGATRIEHIDHAVVATRLELTATEIAALEEPYQPREPIDQ
jgi:aryl-alcohol dehydrogenase-like predicted oxidoreductase